MRKRQGERGREEVREIRRTEKQAKVTDKER